MQLNKKVEQVFSSLEELSGFNADIYLDYMNDMIQARSTAYYTDEKQQQYRRLSFTEANAFVNPAAGNNRLIRTSMILSNLRSAKTHSVASSGSGYF